jgi:hypothetical protein
MWTRSKINSADRAFAFRADFLLSETVMFFFRERFATPVSLCFVPGWKDVLLVDQNNY